MDSMVYKKKAPLIVFLIPAYLFMTIFLYYPFVLNIVNSFQNINGLGSPSKGLNDPLFLNYTNIFTDQFMLISLKNTGVMILCTIIFQVGIALLLALLVDNIKYGAQFFRTAYFFPIVISASALGLLFNMIFRMEGGMINQLLEFTFKVAHDNLPDWKDEAHAIVTMLIPVCWQYVGFYFVIIVTGLNNISSDIYEAASIDGANGFKRVRYITLPLLHNVLCTCLTLAITGALKVFDLPWIMFPKGMPMDKTWMTGTYMYHVTFNLKNVDYGSTISIAIVIIGVVLSQVANAVFKEKDY